MKNMKRTADSIPNPVAYFLVALLLCVLVLPAPAAVADAGTNEDFSAVGQCVVELLQSRDTARFAAELSPAFEDWQSALSTNPAAQTPDLIAGFRPPAHLAEVITKMKADNVRVIVVQPYQNRKT